MAVEFNPEEFRQQKQGQSPLPIHQEAARPAAPQPYAPAQPQSLSPKPVQQPYSTPQQLAPQPGHHPQHYAPQPAQQPQTAPQHYAPQPAQQPQTAPQHYAPQPAHQPQTAPQHYAPQQVQQPQVATQQHLSPQHGQHPQAGLQQDAQKSLRNKGFKLPKIGKRKEKGPSEISTQASLKPFIMGVLTGGILTIVGLSLTGNKADKNVDNRFSERMPVIEQGQLETVLEATDIPLPEKLP